MLDALARSITETAADVLGNRTTRQRAKVSDEEIRLYLWHERGFRVHNTLVALINHAQAILDRPEQRGIISCPPQSRARPAQLTLDLVTA